jgi:hypothetical protein
VAVLILEARDRGNVTGLEGNKHKHKMRRERRKESASPSQYLALLHFEIKAGSADAAESRF